MKKPGKDKMLPANPKTEVFCWETMFKNKI